MFFGDRPLLPPLSKGLQDSSPPLSQDLDPELLGTNFLFYFVPDD